MKHRQAAFENTGNKMLKGALHCHTTRSDGKGTPAEVIRKHYDNGYDFMALTDHRRYNYENFADVPMTILPGMELDSNFEGSYNGMVHCHHIVCVGHTKEHGNGFEQDQRFESLTIRHAVETQPLIDMAHANGNLTIYCHPEWSGTPKSDFDMLYGNFAMEIWNSGCAMENDQDTNAAYWDEMLSDGHRIYGVATDDGHAMNEHCVGWVRVNAKNDVESILTGLQSGAFYSSCGPEIYDFYVENGVAHVECSPVKTIVLKHLRMPFHVAEPAEGETTLTSADFEVKPAIEYVRAVVRDEHGRRAWSNPIFLTPEDFKK